MSADTGKVVVRIPPSPTGFLHVGTARTVLFNYLFAKQHNGKVILRSEDTDKARSKKEYEDEIRENLAWLGFTFDGFFRQSERTDRYKECLEKMIADGTAYVSKEEPKEEGQRGEVIRFKNPNVKITFTDMIRGDITFDTTELGDFVIAKSLEEPLYHLAVVVDDIDMEITHIIRGDDHISNTPRQILIMEALGGKRPLYAHLPLVLAEDKAKLSKRKHGEAVWIQSYKDKGYLPEAIINFLALVGWNPGTEQEIFSMDELIKEFKIERIQKSGAVFNQVKLRSINKHYIRNLPPATLHQEILKRVPNCPDTMIDIIAPVILERVEILSDIDAMNANGELEYYWSTPTIDPDKLAWKNDTPENAKINLTKAAAILEAVNEKEYTVENLKAALMPFAEEVGKGNVLWPLRVSLSGKDKSPDPFQIAVIIGKHETLSRVQKAINLLP
jgi:glutamyl-tRNA synthetase